MKKLIILGLTCGIALGSHAQTPEVFKQWGDNCFDFIEQHFRKNSYNYLYDEDSNGNSPSFAWPTGIQLKAVLYAGQVDKAVGYAKEFDANYYYFDKNYGGYDASCHGRGGRHYDDNAWMVKDYMEIYEATQDRYFLNLSHKILLFCMSGECPSGGIRFKEEFSDPSHEEYDVFATCATAPTAVANLQLYLATQKEKYLEDGKRLYDVMKKAPWGIGPGFRGYENAVVMEAAILLYKATGEEVYLKDAQHLGHAMEAYYISWQTGALNECGKWGGHDMTDAYVEMYKVDGDRNWLDIAARYLTYLHDKCRSDNGAYPVMWNAKESNNPDLLIEQASAASAFYKMALTPGGNPEKKEPVAIFQNEAQNSGGKGWGWSIGLNPGYYSKEDLIFLGAVDTRFNFTPDISSVYVPKGYKLTLYDEDGASIELTRPTNFLNEWDNRAVAVKVEDNSTGMHREELKDVTAFCLKKDGRLIVSNLPERSELEIYDVSGKKLRTERVYGSSTYTMDVMDLADDTYILCVKSEMGNKTMKIRK